MQTRGSASNPKIFLPLLGFTGELRLGESVELRLKEENGETLVAGIRSSDEKPAFLAKLSF